MDPEVFGSFIKQCRHELCISQSELAEKLHVTAKAVSRWERGIGFPDIKLLQPLADALGITIVELMQSKRIEADIPKEEAAEMVSGTVDSLRRQEKLTRNRDWITFFGSMPIMMAMLLVIELSEQYRSGQRWLGFAVYAVGFLGGNLGVRALRRVALPVDWCGGWRFFAVCIASLAGSFVLGYSVWTLLCQRFSGLVPFFLLLVALVAMIFVAVISFLGAKLLDSSAIKMIE